MEQWRAIPGTNGRLLVSDQGRVKSLLRDGRILKATKDTRGYLRLRVTLDRKKKSYKVHRLVAQAFVPNPEGKSQVNHINGIKSDNAARNLEWVTNQENAIHAAKNGLWDSTFKKMKAVNEKKKRKIVARNGEASMVFDSVGEAERFFNSRHISDVAKGRRDHVKGWTFSYAEGGDANAYDQLRNAERETETVSA